MLDLKAFREQKLRLSQSQLAERLKVSQDYISRIEKGAQEPTLDLIRRLCDAFGLSPDQVLSYTPARPEPIDAGTPYADTAHRRNAFADYITASQVEEHIDKIRSTDPDLSSHPELRRANESLTRGRAVVDTVGSKPVGVVLGPSDAGKSRLLNNLTGMDKLIADWTPTTSITVYLKHIEDRPSWFKEEAWVFTAAPEGEPEWDFRCFRDLNYCERWKLTGGGIEVLKEYGTRQGGRSGAGSALIFLDSPILRACDLVDLPGFGSGRTEDDIQAQQAREIGDFIIYLCPATQFMHARDVQFMRDVIRHLPPMEKLNPEVSTMGNLFVVASMAHHVKPQEKLPGVLQEGAARLYSEVHEDTWRRRAELTGRAHGKEDLAQRFFAYTLEDAFLRRAFEEALTELLRTSLPKARLGSLDAAVDQFKAETRSWYEDRLKELEAALRKHAAMVREFEEQQQQVPTMRAKLEANQRTVGKLIHRLRVADKDRLRQWYASHISPSTIESIIRRKDYSKKQAEDLLAGTVSDEIYQELQRTLESSSEAFSLGLQEYLNQFEAYAATISKLSVGGVSASIDMRGLLVGGLAGGGALGALSVLAGAMGNLGGYILIAKGVGLLSAIGISVGGTAAAASFIAAIGGPITLAIGLALGLGMLIKALFGERWETRLAKRLFDQLQEKRVLEQYCSGIDRYWNDTAKGFDQMVANMHAELDRRLEERGKLLTATTPDQIMDSTKLAEKLRDFFAGIPWGPAVW